MIRILLIRHGRTDLLGRVLYGRMPGVHLSSEGVRQSEAVAENLATRVRLAAVLSSPMERAMETAEPLARAQGKGVLVEEGVTEIDFGEWVGKSFDELSELSAWKEFNRKRALCRPPGGESMMEVQARAWQAVQQAAQNHRGGDEDAVAIVTHGDVIRSLLLLILGVSIDHIHRFEIATASVSEILVGQHDPLVRHVNQIFY